MEWVVLVLLLFLLLMSLQHDTTKASSSSTPRRAPNPTQTGDQLNFLVVMTDDCDMSTLQGLGRPSTQITAAHIPRLMPCMLPTQQAPLQDLMRLDVTEVVQACWVANR